MIFNNNAASANVKTESKYDASLSGAMMCVYENELNFNRVMEAAGISELKYYIETGKSLFITEANALTNFFSKIRGVLEKIITKIKELFNKFMTVINSAVMSDKKFVEKYKNQVKGVKLSSFSGYEFDNMDANFIKTDIFDSSTPKDIEDAAKYNNDADKQEAKNAMRAQTIGETGSMTESEFRDALKKKFYKHDGDKYNLTDVDVAEWMGYLESSKDDIKNAKNTRDKTINEIQNYINDLKRLEQKYKGTKQTEENSETRENAIKGMQRQAELYSSVSNDYTIAFGAQIDALKKRRNQAKSICVKGLTSKKATKDKSQSAATSESVVADIFANVTIV